MSQSKNKISSGPVISRRTAVRGLALAVLLPLSVPISGAMAAPSGPDQLGDSDRPVADGNGLRMW